MDGTLNPNRKCAGYRFCGLPPPRSGFETRGRTREQMFMVLGSGLRSGVALWVEQACPWGCVRLWRGVAGVAV